MNQTDVIEPASNNESQLDLETLNINYDKLHGRGAAFLVTPVDKGKVFSREQFSEDHKMFDQAAREYGENRLLEVREDLNVLNKDLSLEILKEMGDLGFLSTDVPEEFGGLALDKTTSCIIVDALTSGKNASILVTSSAHTI
jgi:alkylation response protein AidB-like acyl-CoA dehydrogenase